MMRTLASVAFVIGILPASIAAEPALTYEAGAKVAVWIKRPPIATRSELVARVGDFASRFGFSGPEELDPRTVVFERDDYSNVTVFFVAAKEAVVTMWKDGRELRPYTAEKEALATILAPLGFEDVTGREPPETE